ncbi:MAG TPA: hypothetical protein VK550_07460 [Polyangiaceae bacterium]|nr:hypothetical protein [Polyangiaceae bacterium]
MGQLLVALGSAGAILAARPAWGGPSDIAVRIECPVLSEVSAAEFEARAKVDLSARATGGGELEVVCDDLAAKIRWRRRAGAWVARSTPPTATPATLVDALLIASKELVEEASRIDRGAIDDNAGSDQGATSDQPSPSRADGSDSAEGERLRDSARERSPKERSQDPTPRENGAPSGEGATAPPAPSAKGVWSISAGPRAALFSLRGTGIAGATLGGFVEWPAGFVVSLTGAYDVSIGAGDIVSVRAVSAAAMVAAVLGRARAWEVGAGAFAGTMFVSAEPPYQPTSHSLGIWGAVVAARYALRMDAWRLAMGPDVRFHAVRPEVAVDRASLWGMPLVSVGLSIEVSREVYGSK